MEPNQLGPGLAGYVAGQQASQQQGTAQLQQLGLLQQLMAAGQKQARDSEELKRNEELKAKIMALPPEQRTRENVLPLVMQYLHPKEIVPLLKSKDKDYQPVGAGGVIDTTTGIVTPPAKEATPRPESNLARLLREKQALPEGDTRHPIYDAAIKKESQTAREITPPAQAVGGTPGGVGSAMMQDPGTGQRYLVNGRTGAAWELDDEGQWKATSPANLPKTLTRVGNIGTAGGRESVFTQRMIQAGNQASKDLENVVKLPTTATRGPFGAFGSVTQPSFMDAGKAALGNVMTTQEQQTYNAMSTGFQRTLAAIEAAGLMPSGSLTHQMDSVIFKPGDTQQTKLHKLAQTRQIVESGMEVVLANPRISEDEKGKVREVIDRLQKAVPFTHSDLIELTNRQSKDANATLRSVITKEEAKPAAADAVKEFATEADAAKAGLAPGTKIKVNGVLGTWK